MSFLLIRECKPQNGNLKFKNTSWTSLGNFRGFKSVFVSDDSSISFLKMSRGSRASRLLMIRCYVDCASSWNAFNFTFWPGSKKIWHIVPDSFHITFAMTSIYSFWIIKLIALIKLPANFTPLIHEFRGWSKSWKKGVFHYLILCGDLVHLIHLFISEQTHFSFAWTHILGKRF